MVLHVGDKVGITGGTYSGDAGDAIKLHPSMVTVRLNKAGRSVNLKRKNVRLSNEQNESADHLEEVVVVNGVSHQEEDMVDMLVRQIGAVSLSRIGKVSLIKKLVDDLKRDD